MSSCGSNAGMEMSAPLLNAIVNNALFHSNLHNQSDAASNHSYPQWLKWFCEAGGGSPDEARLEQTANPIPIPTPLIWRYLGIKYTLYCRYKIPRGLPQWGVKYTEGGNILRFSTEIAVYIGNGIRDRPMVTVEH